MRTGDVQLQGRNAENSAAPYSIRVLDAGEPIVFSLEGEVDIDCATACFEPLKDAVVNSVHRTVIVELSGCDFMDSSAVKTLISVGTMAREQQRHLVLSQPSATLQRTFALMRMEQFVTVTGSSLPSPAS